MAESRLGLLLDLLAESRFIGHCVRTVEAFEEFLVQGMGLDVGDAGDGQHQRIGEVLALVGRLAQELRQTGSGLEVLRRYLYHIAHFLAEEVLGVLHVGYDDHPFLVRTGLVQVAVLIAGFDVDYHVGSLFYLLHRRHLAELFGQAGDVVFDVLGAYLDAVRNHLLGGILGFYLYLRDQTDLELEREVPAFLPIDVLGHGQGLSENIEFFLAEVVVHCRIDHFIDLFGQGHRTVLFADDRGGHHPFAESRNVRVLADIGQRFFHSIFVIGLVHIHPDDGIQGVLVFSRNFHVCSALKFLWYYLDFFSD